MGSAVKRRMSYAKYIGKGKSSFNVLAQINSQA